jgi:hypothetical protein
LRLALALAAVHVQDAPEEDDWREHEHCVAGEEAKAEASARGA